MNIALTFDIDMSDYVNDRPIDEIDITFPILQKVLIQFPSIKTTWFFRIDRHMKDVFGKSLYIFEKNKKEIEWLVENGHEIGWHHHAYCQKAGKWVQNVLDEEICGDLRRYGEQALKLGILSTRMGWAFQTNKTMKELDELGFLIDSSAIPRPKYEWEQYSRDWTITSQKPYHPSVQDYRITNTINLRLWEIPITTTVLPSPTDTCPNLMRYINPAYRSESFKLALLSLHSFQQIVLICHPYEIVVQAQKHPLLSFDAEQFSDNLKWLLQNKYSFSTILGMV
jgi:hypothetical protein